VRAASPGRGDGAEYQGVSSGDTINRNLRERRLVFGENAELYDRARPSYPLGLVRDVLRLCKEPPRWMVDVGCGTAKAATLFAAAGAPGVGVEAHSAMAEVARRRLAGSPWRVDVSPFEEWNPHLDDPPVDLLTCAHAWHWVAPDVRFRKAFELIRPMGWLALFWNRSQSPEGPLRQALDAVYAAHEPELSHHSFGSVDKGALRPVDAGAISDELAFGPPTQRYYSWSQAYSAAEWIALLRTQADHRLLSEPRRRALLGEIRQVVEHHGGQYVHQWVSVLWAAQRL
jgi:SAM-dependent methyltransferase